MDMMQAVTAISYFKRYKMDVDLRDLPPVALPPGYRCSAWSFDLLHTHAEVLFACFQQEIDANVFASLSSRIGCLNLMNELSRKTNFLPEATWLLVGPLGPCGTVQGVRERKGVGAIQNLGIAAAHRGQGLGEALLLQALHGFRRRGLAQAVLEVTAQNEGAIRLYRRVGFRRAKTVYKAVTVSNPA
jgi:ribosomal protein S18 acetylase RimI-like enzyme